MFLIGIFKIYFYKFGKQRKRTLSDFKNTFNWIKFIESFDRNFWNLVSFLQILLIIYFRKKERFKYWIQILKMIYALLTAVFIPSELTNFNRQQLVKSRILKEILNVN